MATSNSNHAPAADFADSDWVIVDPREDSASSHSAERDFTPVHERPPCSLVEAPAPVHMKKRCHDVKDIEDTEPGTTDTKKCLQCSDCSKSTPPPSKSPSTSSSGDESVDPYDPSTPEHGIEGGIGELPCGCILTDQPMDPITHLLTLTNLLNAANRSIAAQLERDGMERLWDMCLCDQAEDLHILPKRRTAHEG